MPDDNIFNSPQQENDNVQPVVEEPKVESAPEQPLSQQSEAQNSAEQIIESNSSAGNEQSEPQKYFDARQYISDQESSYQSQNYQPSSQGAYYSYSPNSYNPNNFRGQFNPSQQNFSNYYNPNFSNEPPKKNRKALKITLGVLGVTAIVAAAFFVGFFTLNGLGKLFREQSGLISSSGGNESQNTSSYEELVINSKPAGADEYTTNSDGTMTAAAVIAKVRPSIVGIVQYQNANNGIPTVAGQGSGIIISEDGFIVTNAHVVEGASMITVVLDNEEEYRATIKGLDNQSDLAVIKINENGLPAADLGDSSETVVGESVIAIGNPGGLELAGSCTGGMVSGLERTITSGTTGYAMTYIQTDAAINPGNSGGALVNMYGQVIGINSAKITSDGYENLGFAIPVNEAIPIIADLQNYGYVKNRAKIGIGFQLITESVSQFYNSKIPAGLLITEIDETCDIANKNVEVNDIITKIDDKKITSTSVLYSILQEKKPGDKIKLTVFRIGTRISTSKEFDVTVVLSEDKGTN